MSLGNGITSFCLDDEIIPHVDHAKVLGIYTDELVEWVYYIDHIRKEIVSGI